jgi:hypothetical protein
MQLPALCYKQDAHRHSILRTADSTCILFSAAGFLPSGRYDHLQHLSLRLSRWQLNDAGGISGSPDKVFYISAVHLSKTKIMILSNYTVLNNKNF